MARFLLTSVLVSSVVVGLAVSACAELGYDSLQPHQPYMLEAILKMSTKMEASAEGVPENIYYTSRQVDMRSSIYLQSAYYFFYDNYNGSRIEELASYPRVYTLAASILKRGEPLRGSPELEDKYYKELLDIYKKQRSERINPENNNEIHFMGTETGKMVSALIGSGEGLTEEMIYNSDKELARMMSYGFYVGQPFDAAYKNIEVKSEFLGNIPATFLKLRLDLLKANFELDNKDMFKLRQRFLRELERADLEIKDDRIVPKVSQ